MSAADFRSVGRGRHWQTEMKHADSSLSGGESHSAVHSTSGTSSRRSNSCGRSSSTAQTSKSSVTRDRGLKQRAHCSLRPARPVWRDKLDALRGLLIYPRAMTIVDLGATQTTAACETPQDKGQGTKHRRTHGRRNLASPSSVQPS